MCPYKDKMCSLVVLGSIAIIYPFGNTLLNSSAVVSPAIVGTLPNPFRQSIIPNLGNTPIGQLPPMVTGANPSVINANARFGNVPTIEGETTAEEFNKVFPNG